jgi:hypothetical protein
MAAAYYQVPGAGSGNGDGVDPEKGDSTEPEGDDGPDTTDDQ